MDLTIQLSEEQAAALEARAAAGGVSAAHYVSQVIERELTELPKQLLARRIRAIWSEMPQEVRAKLPSDGASQIDHYVYGLPKSEP